MLSHIHPELKSPLDIFEYIHVGPSGEKARRGVHLPGLWHHIFIMPRTKSSCYVKAQTASSSSQQRQQQQSTAASGPGSAAIQALLQPAVQDLQLSAVQDLQQSAPSKSGTDSATLRGGLWPRQQPPEAGRPLHHALGGVRQPRGGGVASAAGSESRAASATASDSGAASVSPSDSGAATLAASESGAASLAASESGAASVAGSRRGAASSASSGKEAASGAGSGRGAASAGGPGRGTDSEAASGRGAASAGGPGMGAASAGGKEAASAGGPGRAAASAAGSGRGAASEAASGRGTAPVAATESVAPSAASIDSLSLQKPPQEPLQPVQERLPGDQPPPKPPSGDQTPTLPPSENPSSSQDTPSQERKWSPMELWLRVQKLRMRGIPSPFSLPRGIIISILFILNIVSTFFKKMLILSDHPSPEVSRVKRGRPEGPKWYKCEDCGIVIQRKNSVQHRKHCKMTNIKKKIKPTCKWCKKTSAWKSNITRHEKTCPHRAQFIKRLSPNAIWRIGMNISFFL